MFEPLAPRLQCPGLRFVTNLVNHRIATVLFLALDHTHCARVRLSGNSLRTPAETAK